TIALWTYGYPDLLPANTTIFDAVDPNNNRTLNVHLPWGNSQVYWDCGNDGGSYDRINKTASESELEGQWNHWAFTKNRSTGVMRIFLNGQLWHSGSGMTRPINIDIFKLGQNVGANRSYAGRIDDFQVWNKALEEETIREWMRRPMSEQHPNYDNLLIYYDMNEGAGQLLNNLPDPSYNSVLTGVADWKLFRGNELFKDFVPSPLRLNLQLLTEGENITFDYVSVIDSISNPASAVNYFAVEGTDMLLLTNTEYLWPATPSYLISEAGDTLTEYPIQAEGSIDIGELVYYNKRDAKYEILSLVTPYGNGLDLGQAGKTFWFDVTDYAPILKGEKYLSIEMGGQWQEELDIRFYFVEGTPPRDVINIQNIWPFARGWFADIQADNIFEPRQLDLLPEGAAYKIRSAVTGHGQNGEFQPREHYINVNEGNQEFPYDVWKTCGENPMFPQGGTWLFDRAGWCPGMATDIHEFDITNLVSSGGQVTLDYGLNGAFMSEANYLVSNQLVTYGAPNFDVDASLEDIVRPSNRDEYARINPACNSPIIRIKNTGANTLESLRISYGIVGQEMIDYEWTGALPFMAIEEVTLPTYDQSYWQGLEGEAQFVVRIEAPNGASDEYAPNNELTSTFSVPDILDVERLQLHLRTNNRANENSYQILDANGEVLISRANMEDATQYVDELDLPDGCFTLVLNDSGGDGLYYWYWQAIGQNVGSGSLSLKRFINDQIQVPVASFEPEFGNSVRYDFIIPGTVNTEDLAAPRLFSVYPNPVTDQFTLEMQGFASNTFQVQLIDLTGRVLWEQTHNSNYNGQLKENIDLNDWPAGIYSLKVQNGEENRIKTIVKQ
ncbi:MAG: LamG-like jellyroll fold domain-containing protein, partial [Bacteroidota bacterium]